MFQKILVPLDGSELSQAVLPYVKNIALRCDPVEVILLHVVRPPSGHTAAAFVPRDSQFPEKRMPDSEADVEAVNYPIYRDQELASVRGNVEAFLTPIARELKDVGIATQLDVGFGRPAQEIVEYAEGNGVDLIMMCTHGRSGLTRWFLGSVADKVTRGTYVPIMLIRPPGVTRAAFAPQVDYKL
jgi:nucleotide-binding universal stress UspA family protein